MLIIEKINENEIEELRWFVYWVYNECKVLQLVLQLKNDSGVFMNKGYLFTTVSVSRV